MDMMLVMRMMSASSIGIEPSCARLGAMAANVWRAPSGEETVWRKNRYQRGPKSAEWFGILVRHPSRPHTDISMSDHLALTERPDEAGRAATAYREYSELLSQIAVRKYRIPSSDAENLVHDVFLKFLREEYRIRDDRAWLVAAISNASRDYWRSPARRAECGQLPEAAAMPMDAVGAEVDARTLLRPLSARCRSLLRLRYCDGRSADELAALFGTTTGYAKLMLHRCLAAARALVGGDARKT